MADIAAGQVPEIDIAELARLRHAGDVTLIDVREPDEYCDGHVPGAQLIPLGTVPDNVDVFMGKPVLIICKSGGRSMQAAEFLAAQGAEVTNIAGGTMGWVDAGHPVAVGSEPG